MKAEAEKADRNWFDERAMCDRTLIFIAGRIWHLTRPQTTPNQLGPSHAPSSSLLLPGQIPGSKGTAMDAAGTRLGCILSLPGGYGQS